MLKIQTMNLNLIRTFVVLCQSKSFSLAATKLEIDRSNISRHIKNLEEIMETKLINNTSTHSFELTEDGKLLFEGYEKAYNILMLTEKNFKQNKTLNSGKISIGVFADVEVEILKDKIANFKKDYPNVVIKIDNLSSSELYDKLSQYSLDFAIGNRLDEIKKNDGVMSKPIKEEKFCLVYSQKHFNIENAKLNNLIELPLILPVRSKNERMKFDKLLNENNLKGNLSIEVTNYKSSLEYAEAGLGVALLPKNVAEKSDLKMVELEFENQIFISYINEYLSPTAKKMLQQFK